MGITCGQVFVPRGTSVDNQIWQYQKKVRPLYCHPDSRGCDGRGQSLKESEVGCLIPKLYGYKQATSDSAPSP